MVPGLVQHEGTRMMGSLVRRGASVLVAAALLGGGLALGGGTASAQESTAGTGDIAAGSVEIANSISMVALGAFFEIFTAGSTETIGCAPVQGADCGPFA
jgi:hypothetical protein